MAKSNEMLKRKIFLESTIRVYEREIADAQETIKDRKKALKKVRKEYAKLFGEIK